MRIIVFSDTHGCFRAMKEIFEKNKDVTDFIFLGDGEKELRKIKNLYPDKKIMSVKGNCDYSDDSPLLNIFTYENVKIIFTHGHKYNAKYSTDALLRLAKENNAQIVCFGHSHCRYNGYQDGIHILNPGSAAQPRDGNPPGYAFIDITESGIMCSHVNLGKSLSINHLNMFNLS